jgi:hypothetical protein
MTSAAQQSLDQSAILERHAPAPRHIRTTLRDLLVVPVAIFVITRCFLLVLGRFATSLIPIGSHPNRSVLPHSDPLGAIWQWSSPWFRFDAGWYVGIVQHGYHGGPNGVANTNFFPLFPLIARAITPLTLDSAWLAAWLVANLSFLVALIVLWRWALIRWSREVATRLVLLTAMFPFGIFFAAPYAESLFLVLVVAAFLNAELRRWPMAAAFAGLAATTRPAAPAILLALLVMAVQQRDRRAVYLAMSAALPVLAFIGFIGITTGSVRNVLVYHSAGWVPPHGDLLATIGSQFQTSIAPFDRIDAFVSILFLTSSVFVWRKLGPAYALFVILGAALPLVHGLVSMERYVSVLFPVIAVWASWEKKVTQLVFLAVSIVGTVLFTTLFTTGYAIF